MTVLLAKPTEVVTVEGMADILKKIRKMGGVYKFQEIPHDGLFAIYVMPGWLFDMKLNLQKFNKVTLLAELL